ARDHSGGGGVASARPGRMSAGEEIDRELAHRGAVPAVRRPPACAGSLAEEAIMRTIVVVAIALAAMSLTSTVRGAGPINSAAQVAAIPHRRNAWPRCAAWGDFANRIHSPGTAYGTSAGSWNPPDSPRRYRRAYKRAARLMAPSKSLNYAFGSSAPTCCSKGRRARAA